MHPESFLVESAARREQCPPDESEDHLRHMKSVGLFHYRCRQWCSELSPTTVYLFGIVWAPLGSEANL